ncbi:hypothetical protein CYY_003110 [Polysphondylium violaceum]|uniref:BZIP domain-containing protein n=1 Tax=Polysphondylium violaceum TaxID=133409 RepID=A0A8J4PY86_9MYCE|nr:hypothetical protein CYY_003110 [Polysphondylium violaceum]
MDFFLDPNNTNNDVPSDLMDVNNNNNNNNSNNSFFNFNFDNNFESNIYNIVPTSNQDVLLNINNNETSLQQQVVQQQQPIVQTQQPIVQPIVQQPQQQYDNNNYYTNNNNSNNNNNYYIPQYQADQVVNQPVYDNCNTNNNIYYQNQQQSIESNNYWTPQQQPQPQQPIQPIQQQQNIIYTYTSPSDTSTHSDSSPYQHDPSSPTTHNQTSPPSSTSGTSEQCLSSSEESNSNDLSKKVKLIKKRKLRFDPAVDIGPDLKDLLLEVSSEEFRKYKKNFYSGPDVKKSVANVINSQYRKIKNRESAQRSREKKSKYTEELEEQLDKSNKEKDDLVEENKRLSNQVEYLKNQNAKLSAFIEQNNNNNNNGNNSFFSNSNGGLQNFLNSSFSIGSPAQNSKKLLGLFLFFFLFGSFVVQPNFLQYSNNHGHNHAYTQTNTLTTGNSQMYYAKNMNPNTYISNAGPRYNGFVRTTLEKLNDNSMSSSSYLDNNNNIIKPHIMPTNNQNLVLDRGFIKNWATLPQNSKTTISFQQNNAQQLIENSNLDKQFHSVSTNTIDKNNDNKLANDACSSYSGSDEDIIELSPMPTEFKRPTTTTTTTTTTNTDSENSPSTTATSPATTNNPRLASHFYNNSTLDLLVENQLLHEPLHQNSNITKFSNSLFKFSFLFDSDQFPNGSNDISKAFLESDDHQIDITSVIVAINKRPRTQL